MQLRHSDLVKMQLRLRNKRTDRLDKGDLILPFDNTGTRLTSRNKLDLWWTGPFRIKAVQQRRTSILEELDRGTVAARPRSVNSRTASIDRAVTALSIDSIGSEVSDFVKEVRICPYRTAKFCVT